MSGYDCPVCGYAELYEPARSKSGAGSHEICPSCGFQFGVSDDDEGISYRQWRERWIAEGSNWSGVGEPKPLGWCAEKQLNRLADTGE